MRNSLDVAESANGTTLSDKIQAHVIDSWSNQSETLLQTLRRLGCKSFWDVIFFSVDPETRLLVIFMKQDI